MGYHYVIGQPGCISKEQAATISAMVKEIVRLENLINDKPKTYGAVYFLFCKRFKVPSYLRIKEERFPEAKNYLINKIKALISKAKKQQIDISRQSEEEETPRRRSSAGGR